MWSEKEVTWAKTCSIWEILSSPIQPCLSLSSQPYTVLEGFTRVLNVTWLWPATEGCEYMSQHKYFVSSNRQDWPLPQWFQRHFFTGVLVSHYDDLNVCRHKQALSLRKTRRFSCFLKLCSTTEFSLDSFYHKNRNRIYLCFDSL